VWCCLAQHAAARRRSGAQGQAHGETAAPHAQRRVVETKQTGRDTTNKACAWRRLSGRQRARRRRTRAPPEIIRAQRRAAPRPRRARDRWRWRRRWRGVGCVGAAQQWFRRAARACPASQSKGADLGGDAGSACLLIHHLPKRRQRTSRCPDPHSTRIASLGKRDCSFPPYIKPGAAATSSPPSLSPPQRPPATPSFPHNRHHEDHVQGALHPSRARARC
jgi:hypothetical protein